MKRCIALVLFAMTVCSRFAFAQQPPAPLTPQEHLDRARLELAYADREHTMCRQSLSDMWARGNTLEAQVKHLQDEKQKLVDELKALKEPASAPLANN